MTRVCDSYDDINDGHVSPATTRPMINVDGDGKDGSG